ncbi:MAG: hypothetical protein M3Y77_09675, partial [Actinomycetota bacterium]|nr:hypothetical protein [Actinomycetota bacterium]
MGAADVQDFAVGAQDDGDDPGIASQFPGRFRPQQTASGRRAEDRGGAGGGEEIVQGDGDVELRFRRGWCAVTGGDGAAAQFDQGLSAAPPGGAGIHFPVGSGLRFRQRIDGGFQHGVAFAVQGELVPKHPGLLDAGGQVNGSLLGVLFVLEGAVAAVPGEQQLPQSADRAGALFGADVDHCV